MDWTGTTDYYINRFIMDDMSYKQVNLKINIIGYNEKGSRRVNFGKFTQNNFTFSLPRICKSIKFP